jgi:hypothetical protein
MKRLPKLSAPFCTILLALAALAVMAATPRPLLAVSSTGCGGSLTGSVLTSPPILAGNTVNLQYTLGVTATGGTTNTQTITEFDFDLDCANGGSFLSCTEESNNPINWAGGLAVTSTTCKDATNTLVTWGTAHTASATPNQVVLTPNNPVVLPNAGSCTIDLAVLVNGPGNDLSPNTITEAASFTGLCDTGLPGGGIGSDGFTLDTCSVALDKQISCDYAYWHDPTRGNNPGNTTWNDVTGVDDTSGTSTEGCTAFAGDPIAIRYVAKNTGTIDVNSCSVTDVGKDGTTKIVNDFSISGTLAAGSTYDTDAHSLDITTDTTGAALQCPTTLEPNTATLTCTCSGVTPTTTKTASDTATCTTETCDATIDKQVKCQGTTYDVACNDVTNPNSTGCDTVDSTATDSNFGEGTNTQSSNCTALSGHCSDGSLPTNATTCTGDSTTAVPCVCASGSFVAGENVGVTYVITQRGQDELDSCTAVDSNGWIIGTSGIASSIGTVGTNGTIPASTTPPTALTPISFTPQCSTPLSNGEADTATLKCTCASLPGNTAVKTITKTDTATFNCQQPTLSVVKTCATDATTPSLDDFSITATNNGAAGLTNCNVTDTYLSGTTDVTCPVPFPSTAPTGQTLTPIPASSLTPAGNSNQSIAAGGGTQTWTGNISNLSANACNNAVVTCTIGSTATTITASDDTVCPSVKKGCETRTPGFWKTHPDTTSAVMGSSLQSCGLDLNNVMAGEDCSAIEDMCSIGNDAAKLGINPVQANLIFQCAAAELNLAVTQQDGGSCSNTITGYDVTLDTCCGSGGVCATGNTALLSQCQDAVSFFNTLFDTTTLSPNSVLNNPGANPDNCQAANGNGFVNDQIAIGATSPVPDCNDTTGRLYLTKTTGGGKPAAPTNNGKKH